MNNKVAVYRKDNPDEKKILEPGDKAEFSNESKKISESNRCGKLQRNRFCFK